MKRALLLALLPVVAWGADPPRARVVAGTRTVTLHSLPPVLDEEQVAGELDTGLTNTFVVRTVLRRAGHPKQRGGASIRIRYDLWDEIYRVSWTGGNGSSGTATVPSRAELLRWWRSLELPVQTIEGNGAVESWKLKTELAFIPFSQAEQDATRRWLGKSPGSETASPGTSHPGGIDPATTSYGAALDVLVATSLRPDAILQFTWDIPVTKEAARAAKDRVDDHDAHDGGAGRRLPAPAGSFDPQPDGGRDSPGGGGADESLPRGPEDPGPITT